MNFELNIREAVLLAEWLETRAARKLLKNGAKLALVFSNGSGIGTSVEAKLRDKDGNELSKDITDYLSW
jgi:hypothetical protein